MKQAAAISQTINVSELKKAALLYRAINHKLRQKLMKTIHKKGRIGVTAIRGSLRLEQPVASLHLAILRQAGLVTIEREGRQIHYTINYKRLRELHKAAEQMLA